MIEVLFWMPVALGLMSQYWLTRKRVLLGAGLSLLGNILWICTIAEPRMIFINATFAAINIKALYELYMQYRFEIFLYNRSSFIQWKAR